VKAYRRTLPAVAALMLLGTACSGTDTTTNTVTNEIPACSPSYPTGTCTSGQSCFEGACVATASLCSPTNLSGTCSAGLTCYGGGCVLPSVVPPVTPTVDCNVMVNTAQPVLKFAIAKPLCSPYTGAPAGGVACTYDNDPTTPVSLVEVPYVQKAAITVGGLQFRDLNANGTLDKFEDWRYPAICRAQDLVTKMSAQQKIGLMSEGSTMGGGTADGLLPGPTSATNTSGVIQSIAYDNRRQTLIRLGARTAQELAAYLNNVQAMAEGLPLGIPVAVTADPVHGMGMSTSNAGVQTLQAPTVVTPWPYPLGLGAINDATVTRQYGDAVRREFRAMGFRWQLGPMADLGTEPRWARVQNVFGENAFQVAKHVKACIEGFQGSADGGVANGIAATMKHFPGAGANEAGKDSHTSLGKWNVYPGDNFRYHQISFQAAIDTGVAAVMPCYSIFKGQAEDPEQTGAAFSTGLITDYLKAEMGFTGMVTSDWGTMAGAAHGVEALTQPERAAMFVKAGSHQLGNDSHTIVQAAYDQHLLADADIDGAAVKILEMSFKLGLFENPYVDLAAEAGTVRSAQNLKDGFDAQKKAIVLLRNTGAARLPISGTRFTNNSSLPGGTAGPDVGEFGCDTNSNGSVEVYYDGVTDALNGVDIYSPILADYDYRAAGSGVAGTNGFTLPIVSTNTLVGADIAVLRITAHKGQYFGLDNGVPLSFDKPFPGYSTDPGLAPAIADAHKVIDLFRAREGYTRSDGTVVAPTNPTLKIVLVMHFDRPGIVKPFINGLKTLDETPGVPGSYPLVSSQANVNQTVVTTSTPTAKAGVEVFLVDFGAFDRALLDVLFNKNPLANWTYGQARLPMEIPSSDEEVEAQFEDLPADTWSPTYTLGAGSNLPAL
jgi:beta-glucosidase